MSGKRSLFGKICMALGWVLAIVTAVVIARTLSLQQRSVEAAECKPLDVDFIEADSQVLDRFRQGLRFHTISNSHHDYDRDELIKIQEFIKHAYPVIHSSPLVSVEVIANYSLLYSVRGSNPALKPFMLAGHLDVVPIAEDGWTAPPFSADIVDGFIYARGTIDMKHIVFGCLEALEFLLKRGRKPTRSFYLGFGHDEEVGGNDGAKEIAATLLSRDVRLEFLLDEGMVVADGLMPGLDRPVALIGSSEKGRVTLKLSVSMQGGHSSLPPKESTIGVLAQAVSRLEQSPHPDMLGTGPEQGMFEHIAPYMSIPFRVLMSNLWLFGPLVSRFLSMKPQTNAIMRTTTAVTKFNAGVKENVIAPYAEAYVNHRVHPSQSIKEVIEFDRRVINDERVKMEVYDFEDPLPMSPYGDEYFGWQTIKTSIRQVWGYKNVIVAPSLMLGNTDTRHYTRLTDDIYRFSPSYMHPEDLARIHGKDERISIRNYQDAINFLYHVMINADSEGLEPVHSHGKEL